jgi:hypothetical protein
MLAPRAMPKKGSARRAGGAWVLLVVHFDYFDRFGGRKAGNGESFPFFKITSGIGKIEKEGERFNVFPEERGRGRKPCTCAHPTALKIEISNKELRYTASPSETARADARGY